MSIFKCKMCGGSLEVQKGQTICECEYCGTKQTVSAIDDEVTTNLYNRANNLRIKCEFDKAQEIYEKIVAKNPNEAEAYWGIVLCKYGIEYVEDPNTYKRVPTCHRTQLESVLTDVDYLSAMENADSNQKLIYEQEAKEIDKLQKDILSIVHNEKPFDVFICYKETDENGKRTVDSVLANDIYYQLTQEGLKVFYAAITLENKLGQEYEPYIFSVLNSAKVMLVVGTKPENFNAVWVKNEWSRYLKLMNNDRSKTLIPCFRDMDAYDLPDEFSHLQAQDMGKIGFINDIVRGIKKLIAPAKEQPTNTVVVESNNTDIAPLLKRAFIFLEDGNWKDADEYCERVLDLDPENAQAYLGKLMAELKVHKQDDLAKLETSFDESDNYIKAARYANEKLRDKLNSYLDVICYNADEKMYQISVDLMAKTKTEKDFINLAESFELLENFKDSKELAAKCRDKAEEARKETIYLNAIKLYNSDSVTEVKKSIEEFNKIVNYKDVDDRIILSEEKMKQLNSIAKEQQIVYLKKRKRKFIIVLSIVAVIIVGIVLAFVITNVIKSNNYNSAIQMLESGQYQEAYDLFYKLGNYKDSKKQMDNTKIEMDNAIIETQISNLKNINVGDVIKFGIYGDEDIEWQVLDKKDNEIFVITKYIYSYEQYGGCDWKNSSIREKLNSDDVVFYFNKDAKAMIQTTNVIYKDENGAEKNTADKLFLLSVDEYNKYFKNPSEAKFTPAKNNTGYHPSCWMLRSPTSGLLRKVECVSGVDGEVFNSIDICDDDYVGVRPAMWINLEKYN